MIIIEKYATLIVARFRIQSYSAAKKPNPVILGKSYHSENEPFADLSPEGDEKLAASAQGLLSGEITPPLIVINTPEA